MTQLIGMTGRMGAGKNTAASFIEKWAGGRGLLVAQRGFADKLKHSAARIFFPEIGLQDAIDFCNWFKFQGSTRVDGPMPEAVWRRFKQGRATGREFLQRYGTEAHREIFGMDFWVDALLPETATGYGPYMDWERGWANHYDSTMDRALDLALVTDVRFPNEAQRIQDLGGKVWEIHRGGSPEDTHASEQPLPPDLIDQTIYNATPSLDVFERVVIAAIEKESESWFSRSSVA